MYEIVPFIANHVPEFAIGVTSSLIAGYIIGALHLRRTYRHRYKAAIQSFTKEMGKVIDSAYSICTEEQASARLVKSEGRSIVSVRNNFGNTLSALKEVLNSEIDRLEREIEELERNLDDNKRREDVKETISVLKKTWKTKSIQTEIALRRLLAEIGLREI